MEEMQGLAQILNHLYAFIQPMVLKCTVQLRLVEIINSHGCALTLTELAAELPFESVNQDLLRRILRYLVRMHLFTLETVGDGEVKYGLNPACRFLLKDGEKSIVATVLGATDEGMLAAWHCLGACVDGKVTIAPFEMKHGNPIWEMVARKPELNRVFNEAMAAETRVIMSAVVREGGAAFQGIRSLVDVGGGMGMAAGFIVRAFPHIKCSVLDLPSVVAAASECTGNVTLVPGDMFASVPPADAVLLKNVLHDWGDDECIEILRRCKEAIPKEGGKVIIVDIVMDSGVEDVFSSVRLGEDMVMAVLTTGKERSKEEWKKLLQTAGFDTFKITPILSPQFVIEAYPN